MHAAHTSGVDQALTVVQEISFGVHHMHLQVSR